MTGGGKDSCQQDSANSSASKSADYHMLQSQLEQMEKLNSELQNEMAALKGKQSKSQKII
jgi:hypothetical protein